MRSTHESDEAGGRTGPRAEEASGPGSAVGSGARLVGLGYLLNGYSPEKNTIVLTVRNPLSFWGKKYLKNTKYTIYTLNQD